MKTNEGNSERRQQEDPANHETKQKAHLFEGWVLQDEGFASSWTVVCGFTIEWPVLINALVSASLARAAIEALWCREAAIGVALVESVVATSVVGVVALIIHTGLVASCFEHVVVVVVLAIVIVTITAWDHHIRNACRTTNFCWTHLRRNRRAWVYTWRASRSAWTWTCCVLSCFCGCCFLSLSANREGIVHRVRHSITICILIILQHEHTAWCRENSGLWVNCTLIHWIAQANLLSKTIQIAISETGRESGRVRRVRYWGTVNSSSR